MSDGPELPLSVMDQAEVDQPAQVEGGDSMREAELIALNAAEAYWPVSVADEPRDGALDHRAPTSVLPDPDPFFIDDGRQRARRHGDG